MGILGAIQGVTLTILELSLSFDNAVINASILATMAIIWRKNDINKFIKELRELYYKPLKISIYGNGKVVCSKLVLR